MNKVHENYKKIFFPMLSILLSFIIGGILVKMSGHNPLDAYKAMFEGSIYSSNNPKVFLSTLVEFVPLSLTGLAVAFAFKCGLFNIGVEGQYMMGVLCATPVGLIHGIPAIIHVPLTILAGMTGGALWGFIPGFLKAKFGTHEVILSIMLNYIAFNLSNWTIRNVLSEPGKDFSKNFLPSARLFQFDSETGIHVGVFVALAAIAVIYILLNRTVTGYEVKAVGLSQTAAEYGGISIKKNIILAMLISGGLAGLGGVCHVSGYFGYSSGLQQFSNYGFDGLALALVGKCTPIGVLLSALLFACLHNGANGMQFIGVPMEIGGIIQGTIILFVAGEVILRYILSKDGILKKKNKVRIENKGR